MKYHIKLNRMAANTHVAYWHWLYQTAAHEMRWKRKLFEYTIPNGPE
jgi:hypothetical protein